MTRYNRSMGQPQTIAIAGGGVIGLACALALRQRGHAVTLFEAGNAAREASWAAGGMLAADDPENPIELLPLSRYSRSLYPEFLRTVESLSGMTVPLRTTQTLQIPEPDHPLSAGRRLAPEETRALIPELTVDAGPFFLLEEHSLDPRDLGAALTAAVVASGVTLQEQTRILHAEPDGDDVRITTSRGTLHAEAFVNACGAWAAALDKELGVKPSKGQMIAVAQPEHHPLTRVLRSPGVYMIPRDRHRIVIGATLENAGFSKALSEEGLDALRSRAARLWPPAASAPLLERWAGLRPATPDALPILGRCDNNRPLWSATGHYRNGILLAPATGQILADLLDGRPPAVELDAFAPRRAGIATACDKPFAAAL